MSSAAATTYKKRSGNLAVDGNRTHLVWTEGGASSPTLTLPINDIVSECNGHGLKPSLVVAKKWQTFNKPQQETRR